VTGHSTFEAICEALGIEPDCLRNGLHQWRVKQFGGMILAVWTARECQE